MTSTAAERHVTVRCPMCDTKNRVDLARIHDGPRCADCRRPILLDRPLRVSGQDLDETLRSAGVPVLLDLYADWCGPCRAMAPVLDELAARFAGRLLVLKLDTDRAPDVAARLGIRGIPTLIAFERGQETGRHVGMADLPTLTALMGLR
jgi:thioredoxin 2